MMLRRSFDRGCGWANLGGLFLIEFGSNWEGNKDSQIVRLDYFPGAAAP